MRRYRAIAEYYDAEYARHGYLERDVPFFLSHLPQKRQDVLELAVGTGRAAIPMAQAGHRVVGVDYSPAMLEVARRKRDGVGLLEREGRETRGQGDKGTRGQATGGQATGGRGNEGTLELVEGDVMEWTTRRRFDWVVILFNTFLVFTTLEQQDAVLERVRRHLKPGGRFWIDIFHPDMALLVEDRRTGVDPIAFHVPRYGRTVFKTTEIRRHDASRQVQRVTFHYTWFDEQGREKRERTSFDMTFIYPRELRMLLERHGFEVEGMWGDYSGGEITAKSERVIVCARRGGGR
jgi:SAM-dependent methyltransferase